MFLLGLRPLSPFFCLWGLCELGLIGLLLSLFLDPVRDLFCPFPGGPLEPFLGGGGVLDDLVESYFGLWFLDLLCPGAGAVAARTSIVVVESAGKQRSVETD